jgi:hypothetical protein
MPEIIATVLSEMLTGGFNHPRATCLLIGAIDLMFEGMGVAPPPILQSVVGSEKLSAHI